MDIGIEGHETYSKNSLNLLSSACPSLPAHPATAGMTIKTKPPTRIACAPRVISGCHAGRGSDGHGVNRNPLT